MNAAEIRTRVAQELRKRNDLLRHHLGLRPESIRFATHSVEGKFFFERGQAAIRSGLVRQHLPDHCTLLVREADEICAHRFCLLGYESLDYGPGKHIDWHFDAVHRKHAPLRPWFRIPFLDFQVVGDHKVIWELNRHQHLVTLAKAWLLTREERYLDELKAQWRSWVKANPYPLGINWGSTLEVAFRSLSWIWVDHLLASEPSYSDLRAEMLPALAFHGRYIDRYLSTYFSPNTHLLGEAVAMFALGVLYPQMTRAARWKTTGWQILLHESNRQVRPDGVYFEQSLYYHVYALDFFLHARILAAANGVSIPAAYDQTVGKMLDVLNALAQSGPAEGFGDDDGGRLFDPRRNRTEHMTDPLAVGAVALGRKDLAAAHLTEESIWLYGDRAIAELSPDRQQPAPSSVAFPDGGIYVLAGEGRCRQTMMIDAGPQGAGRCGHGHADALSLRLTMNGSRWLVDSGSGVYISSNLADRNSFRGTAAHNTIRVDELDQALPEGPFSWTQVPNSRADSWIAGHSFSCFSGSHDGYARLPDAVTHRRSVLRVYGSSARPESDGGPDDGIWLVRDLILGAAEHEVELRWHFASQVDVRDPGAASELVASMADTNQPTLRLVWPDKTAWTATVARGVLSPAYGRYEPAPLLQLAAHIHLPSEIATALLAQPSAAQSVQRVQLSNVSDMTVQVYQLRRGEESNEFFFARDKRPWSFGPWASDCELLYCRTQDGKITQLIAIGGSSVQWQGGQLLKAEGPSRYFEWRLHDSLFRSDPASFAATTLFDQLTGGSFSSRAVDIASSYAEKH